MKRFTDTCKWDDPWFRALPGVHKLVFLYIIDRCNNAGFWEVDMDSLAFHTKLESKHLEGALKGLERGLKGASGWVWVRRFLRHQKHEPLNQENPAHRQIITLISEQRERFQHVPEFKEFEGALKGLNSPMGTGKGKGEGSPEGTTETDEKWIADLEKQDCYRPIEIRTELGKAQVWCRENHRRCTRKFFVNWLNRALENYRVVGGAKVEPMRRLGE
jgi:hypothetical protein